MSLLTTKPQASVTVGGVTLPLSKAIIMGAQVTAAASYSSLWRNNAVYTVPVGYKLVICAWMSNSTGATVSELRMGYGDTDTSTTAPTNAVGRTNGGGSGVLGATPVSAAQNGGQADYYEVPAGKIPYVRNNSTANVFFTVMGYLVKV